MNNYHLFLIRSDSVTQLAAHLVAGIVALALIFTVFTPKHAGRNSGDTTQNVPTVGVTLPPGTTVLAASGSDLR